MRRSLLILAIFSLTPIGSLCADEKIASVQQALKEQGFYYGEVTGRKDADTTAAIRRFQIRNGLKITGNLDAETERSLRLGVPGSARPQTRAAPSPLDETSDLRDDSPDEEIGQLTPRQQPVYPSQRAPFPPVSQPLPYGGGPYVSGIFADTPYEVASPGLQQRVIANAQMVLARRGYYRSDIDGVYGPGTEFALRAFQSQIGLPRSGRFDMETLSALGLLPGQQAQRPRRRFLPRSIYRGEWIPQ